MEQGTSRQNSLPPPPPLPHLLVTPSDIPADPDGSLPWWQPTWGDIARRLGWRWVYIVPLVLLLLVIVWAMFSRYWFFNLLWYGGKLWLWLGAVAVGAVVQAIRQATSSRTDPFCIHCGYTLAGLPDQHICPECGRRYSFELIKQYQQDPRWFQQRWKLQHGNPQAMPFQAGKVMGRASGDGT